MKKLLFTLLLLPFFAQAQTVTTYAGNGFGAGTGAGAYTGDGGAADSAELSGPYAIALDDTGNLYIADQNNAVIRKVTTGGIISTFAGNGTMLSNGDGGPATAAAIGSVYGIVVDRKGNVYIADDVNKNVRKVNTNGIISTYGTGTAFLSGPTGLAVDTNGNLYISSTNNDKVLKEDTNGVVTTFAGGGTAVYGDGGPADSAILFNPIGLTIDNLGNVYISEAGGNKVRKVDTAGIITTIAGNGGAGYHYNGESATLATIDNPGGIGADTSGNLYIADEGNNRVREVHDSIMNTIACNGSYGYTGDGGIAIDAEFRSPNDVKLDRNGNIYIADYGNNVIRRISTVTTKTQLLVPIVTISLFPNPATSQLTIQSTNEPLNNITITNILGQTVYTKQNINSQQLTADCSLFPGGVYFVKVNGSEVRKFVKE